MKEKGTLLELIEPKGFWEDRKTAFVFWDGAKPLWYQTALSRKKLRKLVYRFAAGLISLGLGPGDRVALLLPNSPQFVIAYFGALAAGCIVVPLNPLYKNKQIASILLDSGAAAIVLLDCFYNQIAEIKRSETKLEYIIFARVGDGLRSAKKLGNFLKELKEKRRVPYPQLDLRVRSFSGILREGLFLSTGVSLAKENDIVLLMYTSGTTAEPKGVALTHKALLANAKACRNLIAELTDGNVSGQIILAAVPYFHILGLSAALHAPLMIGSEIILIPNPKNIVSILEAIEFTGGTIFIGLPRLYEAIVSILKQKPKAYDISSLEICISGSSELTQNVRRSFEEIWGKKMLEGFGMTELGGATHCQRWSTKDGSVGSLLEDIEQRISDPDEDGVGGIELKGSSSMVGYWSKDGGVDVERTSKVLNSGGWYRTGDLGKIDENGDLFWVGRNNDRFKAFNGESVYASDIEHALMLHPHVIEAAVTLIGKDEKHGERWGAFVVLRKRREKSPCESFESFLKDDIKNHLKTHLNKFQMPHEIYCREFLPKGPTGKILKRKLRPVE